MIASQIIKKIGEALKAKDELRLSTLRMLASALNYEKIAKQHDLTAEEELVVVKKEAKKRSDAIEAYEKAGAQDRADKEKGELAILKEYLPADMSDSDLAVIIDRVMGETGAKTMADMGKVIGLVVAQVKGGADGGRVAKLVKERLENGASSL